MILSWGYFSPILPLPTGTAQTAHFAQMFALFRHVRTAQIAHTPFRGCANVRYVRFGIAMSDFPAIRFPSADNVGTDEAFGRPLECHAPGALLRAVADAG